VLHSDSYQYNGADYYHKSAGTKTCTEPDFSKSFQPTVCVDLNTNETFQVNKYSNISSSILQLLNYYNEKQYS